MSCWNFWPGTPRDSEFDIKAMYRTICNTRAYQRKFATASNSEDAIKHFAARTVKPMLPEQYVDSLFVGLDRVSNEPLRRRLIQTLTRRNDLNEDYQHLWDYRETVQQLMQTMTFQFRGETGERRAVPMAGELYLRILTRSPTTAESEICSNQAPENIMFALALSNEFCFNH